MKKLIVTACLLSLSGCNLFGVSESFFEKRLNEYFKENLECVSFPTNENDEDKWDFDKDMIHIISSTYSGMGAILQTFVDEGYVTREEVMVNKPFAYKKMFETSKVPGYRFKLAESAKRTFEIKNGTLTACYGMRVATVDAFKEQDMWTGHHAAEVKYRYTIEVLPAWAKKENVVAKVSSINQAIASSDKPREATEMFVETDTGWQMARNMRG